MADTVSQTVLFPDLFDKPLVATFEALTPLYVKTLVQTAWTISWRARKSVMTRW